MKVQEELEKILADEAVIECREEELARLESLAEKSTASMDGEAVQRSRNLDPLGEAYVKIELKKAEIKRLKAENERRKDHYRNIIDNLRKPVFIKILYGRYYLGKTLKQIAKEMGYCKRNIEYLHGNALQAVANAEKRRK